MTRTPLLAPRTPVATYRLQFNGRFTFRNALRILNYLEELGISDIYSSPVLKARSGSLHGYDIVDPTTLNPEVGTDEDFFELAKALRGRGMGQILDVVPNHLCITSKDNNWWMDVLENGPSSPYADFFDINWEPIKDELRNKVLLPILGDQYGKVLSRREILLTFDQGTFHIGYWDHRLPVRPKTYAFILKHRLSNLTESLMPRDADLLELLSILTAIEHLPDYHEKKEGELTVRWREKEIIKKRLWQLYRTSERVRLFIEENVAAFNGADGDTDSLDLLDELVSGQVYRLADWRVAADEINYRRFFDINDLAAIHVENPDTFGATHRLIFEMVRKGAITGLRVDHCDGLYDPARYLRALQKHCFVESRLGHVDSLKGLVTAHGPSQPNEAMNALSDEASLRDRLAKDYDKLVSSNPSAKVFYVVGEKILTKAEQIPDGWPVFGTTGYDFLNSVNAVFINKRKALSMSRIYTAFTGITKKLPDLLYEEKKEIMYRTMFGDIDILGQYLDRISEKDRDTRDFTRHSLTVAIVEVMACFPIYRTYVTESGVNRHDRRYIEQAVAKAKRRNRSIDRSVFDFLRDVLVLRNSAKMTEADRRQRIDFAMRFQQLTGPVMAKAVEDTSYYLYNRLISLNEVGGNPEKLGISLEAFHGQNMERVKSFPHAMIATSTHDSKRSEDVRARINVISEMAEEWGRHVVFWSKVNKRSKFRIDQRRVPEPNEEYLLYQTLVGTWPMNFEEESEAGFKSRIKGYMIKVLREAKVNSSWIAPDIAYEEACLIFIDSILNREGENAFLEDFEPFQKKVSHYGMLNSLSQTLLKIGSPGVPDFYQGTDIWDFSLVDPDNRRPVDYELRQRFLRQIRKAETEKGARQLCRELSMSMEDGRIKLYVISKALKCRRLNRAVFEDGRYVPLEVTGFGKNNVVAFLRASGRQTLCVVVPRLLSTIAGEGRLPFGSVWKDTFVIIPSHKPLRYRNIYTEEILSPVDRSGATGIPMSELLSDFPVALLTPVD